MSKSHYFSNFCGQNHTRAQVISILERTPSVLQQLLGGLSPEWIHNNEGEGTWSPYDIIGHYIHGEKTDWIPRAQLILSNNSDKNFIPFDRFAQGENSKGKTISELLDEFETLRLENINTLKQMNLSPHNIDLKGLHPEFGKVTLSQLLATWAVHDLSHIHQITRVLAKNYSQAIGPWNDCIAIV